MRRGSAVFLIVAAALALPASTLADGGGLPAAARKRAEPTAAQPRQIAAQSACTCRRGRWIVTSSPGYTGKRGRRLCRGVYRRSKIRGARLARYHPGTGRCFICYRGNVVCPRGVVPRVGTGRTRGTTGSCRIPPRTSAIIYAGQYSVSGFFGSATVCLTPREARERGAAKGTGVRYLNQRCTKCRKGYRRVRHRGSTFCARCPRGRSFQNNCCY